MKVKLTMMWKDALESLVKSPATQRYPFVRLSAPDQLRSKLHWNLENCTGCGLCAKDCPADAIKIIVLDKKAKRFVFRYQVDHCTFCSQCVVSCRQDCLSMANNEWELAALNKDKFTVYYGHASDVESVMEDESDAENGEPAGV
ncbi:MAG: 4Fe-4S binding protein [Chloroflexi bacterium]|nr:4Fe-4S binding protein [Chloroflexota bacterium]